MNPRHIGEVTDPKRRAIAPYNFVELPEKVVEAQPLPDQDCYHEYSEHLINGETVQIKRHTGKIECTLTTESPLYTRCGWSAKDFAEHGETAFKDLSDEIQKLRANFFINTATNQPVIPGSSLRGVLRTLVEIVSFSKIERVSGNQRLFFRAVASNPDKESWGREYKQYVKPEIVKAGYLIKNGETWLIQPAELKEGKTFVWVQENSLDLEILGLQEFNSKEYKPKYIPVSYTNAEVDQDKRLFAHDVDLPDTHFKKGVLVTSGNMKQTDDGNSPRCNHCIVFPQDQKATPLPIDDKAIEHYRNALTDFQKEAPFNKDWGVLEKGRPVFYYYDGQSKTVGFFGQSPNFRIPYSPEGNGHATTVIDFIPTKVNHPYVMNWRNAPIRFSMMLLNINLLVGILFLAIPLIDLSDSIFGWVKQDSIDKKLPKNFNKQRSGRVCVTDGLCESNQDDIWYSENPLVPQILSEPKPSYFPHYLVQPSADKLELKHYASKPLEETVIRGHKLYWHKGSNPDFKLPPPKKVIGSPKKASDTQTTLIKPVKKGISFKFYIHFENLSEVELGALLWVLSLSSEKSQTLGTGKAGEKYCFSLGMGKPLGMGAVKIDYELHLSDRPSRYRNLFDGALWKTGEENQTDTTKKQAEYIKAFENFMLAPNKGISEEDRKRPNGTKAASLKETKRIEMLLTMLRCDETPNADQTRYMTIEAKEYQNRPVLPTPLQVIDDSRRLNNPPPSPSTSGGFGGISGDPGGTPKPILKGRDKDKPIKKSQQSQQQQKPKDNSEGGNSAALARPQKPKP